jgi:hypothetical protein
VKLKRRGIPSSLIIATSVGRPKVASGLAGVTMASHCFGSSDVACSSSIVAQKRRLSSREEMYDFHTSLPDWINDVADSQNGRRMRHKPELGVNIVGKMYSRKRHDVKEKSRCHRCQHSTKRDVMMTIHQLQMSSMIRIRRSSM